MPIDVITERKPVSCPRCDGLCDVEWCRDADGEFEKTSCRECRYIKIVDPKHPDLQGETRF